METHTRSAEPANARCSTDADKRIGRRIKARRIEVGLSQSALGDLVQKIEAGVNRVAASRLARVAAALEKPVSFFFDHGEDDERAIDLVQALAYADPARADGAFMGSLRRRARSLLRKVGRE